MTAPRLPLYAKLITWLALNVCLVALLLLAFAAPNQSGLNLLATQSVRDHLHAFGRDVAEALIDVPDEDWAAVLAREGAQHGVLLNARPRRGPPGVLGSMPPTDPPPPPRGGPRPMDVRIATVERDVYEVRWQAFGMRHGMGLAGGHPLDIELSARTTSFAGLLRFLGVGRELTLVGAVLVLSALLWWPFVWHITRSIRAMAAATGHMAVGRLETRVSERRRDELGDLATAINTMAERLQYHLHSQQQFIADVAHEVISPVARMQIGLGILENHVPAPGVAALADVREDLAVMSEILDDLLLFSRSGLQAGRTPPVNLRVDELVREVIDAEAEGVPIVARVSPALTVVANPTLLKRALANLVRNACRYAADAPEPVEISAQAGGDRVHLWVRDRGPGVPEAALARLGEAFYRPELSRSRASGGFGLGLAIVRRCVAGCNGEVAFRNRTGGGFEVQITLPAGESE